MKKNLFKKVAAFVTAASMVASLGTVAFAANYDGTGIKITNVTYDKTVVDGKVVPGEYDVTVSYTVDEGVKNDIGVTMLAYTGENLSVDKDEYTKYNNSMQIVGIDQQKQSEEQTGSFEFKVTTNDDGAIKVAYGVPSIILVSGDKVAPAAAAFTIKEEKTADSAELTYETTIGYYSYQESDLGTIIKNTLSGLGEVGVATIKDAKGTEIGTVSIPGAYIKSVELIEGAYIATATIPAGTEVTSNDYNVTISKDIDVTFAVAVEKIKWEVTSTYYETDNNGTHNKLTIPYQASLEDVKAEVERRLAGVGVTVANENATKTIKSVTVAIPEDATYEQGSEDDQTVICNVTADITDDPDVMVNEGNEAVLTFDLEVTVRSATAEKWEIESATMSGDPIVFNDQEKDVTADDLLDAVTTEIQSRTITFVGANDGETETVPLTDAGVAVKEAATFTYTVTVPASAADFANIPEDGGYTFDVVVTVKYVKPAGTYGDVDNSGVVDMSDAAEIMRYYLGYDSSFKVDAIYADVDNSGVIDMSDAAKIMQYYLGYITSLPDES